MNKNFLEQSIYSDAISLIGGTSEEIEISLPEEKSCIGQYGRLHKEYLRKNHPDIYFELVHADTLWTYLADINGQVQRALQILSDSHNSDFIYRLFGKGHLERRGNASFESRCNRPGESYNPFYDR